MNAVPQDTLLCPHCETRNANEAVLCHFCGADLPRAEEVMKPIADAGNPEDRAVPTVPMIHRGVADWVTREGNVFLIVMALVLLPVIALAVILILL